MSMLRDFLRRLARPNAGAGHSVPRERRIDGHRVVEDLGAQIFTLSLRANRASSAGPSGSVDHPGERLPEPCLASVASDGFVGGAVLAEKARRFDQRLLASIERVAYLGAGDFAGRNAFLRALARAVAGTVKPDEAVLTLMTAARVGGAGLPEPFGSLAQARAQAAIAATAPPTGIFTSSRELESIHRQLAMLEAPLDGLGGIGRMVEVLRSDGEMAGSLRRLQQLRHGLENPSASATLLDLLTEGAVPRAVPLFSPRQRFVRRLEEKLLPDGVPPGDPHARFDALLRRLRAQTITPGPDSGWHDWLAWTLEPLARPETMPEAARLRLSDPYRASVLEILRSALEAPSSVRLGAPPLESHEALDPPSVIIRPNLRVEPLATYYLRRGLGYRFLHQALVDVLGEGTLASLTRETAEGEPKGIRDELREMEALFLGAFAVACEDIGMKVDPSLGAEPGPLLRWMETPDADLARDSRELVPIELDPARGRMRALLFLGWRQRWLEIGYLSPPPASVFDANERLVHERGIRFEEQLVRVPAPVALEVYVDAPIARSALRELGDRAGSVEELVHGLG